MESSIKDSSNGITCSNTPLLLEFPLFSLFPMEIRMDIWAFAHPPPRTISVSLPRFQHKRSYAPAPLQTRSGFALLRVNHEARNTILGQYERIFVGSKDLPKKLDRHAYGVLFNFQKDSLCMTSGLKGLHYYLTNHAEIMLKVRYLDICPEGHKRTRKFTSVDRPPPRRFLDWSTCKVDLRHLPHLKLIIIKNEKEITYFNANTMLTPWVNCNATWTMLNAALVRSPGQTQRGEATTSSRILDIVMQFQWIVQIYRRYADLERDNLMMRLQEIQGWASTKHEPVYDEPKQRLKEMGIWTGNESIEGRYDGNNPTLYKLNTRYLSKRVILDD